MTAGVRGIYWAYLTALIVPAGALLYLQYESIMRQRQMIRDLTAANMAFAGQRLAAQLEQDYYEAAQSLLYQGSAALGKHATPRSSGKRNSPPTFKCPQMIAGFDQLFVLEPQGSVLAVCGAADIRAAGRPVRYDDELWRDSYAALLRSNEPGKVLPLGIADPAPAQFFYMEDALGRYLIVSADLHEGFRERNSGLRSLESRAYILGASVRARIVKTGGAVAETETVVRFPTLFPFWRLALTPAGPREEADHGVVIFAGLTSMVLFLLGFALLLFSRDTWRKWHLSQVREEFVQGISHDLRGPVTNISMYSEMLLHGGLGPDETRAYHAVLFKQAQLLSRLVQRVLEVPRVKRGARVLNFSICEPRALVLDALTAVRARVLSAGFRIDLKEADSLPLIRCDRDAIVQCLADLLDNAVKYSGDARDIEIELAARDGALRMTVRDHGIGIPSEEIPHISEQFFRASNARAQLGYGLGLYLVKAIMDEHGGSVEISSILSQGSEFCLILPV